jgi:hypothetical protein
MVANVKVLVVGVGKMGLSHALAYRSIRTGRAVVL